MTAKVNLVPKLRMAAILFACGALHALYGQTSTATIVGVVTDPSGLAVANAKADIRNVATNEVRQVESAAGDAMEQAGAAGPRTAWTPAQSDYVRKLFTAMISHFQSRYPALRFTYSLTSYVPEVRALGLQLFDVIEVHLFTQDPRLDNRTGFGKLEKDRGDHDYKDYARRLRETMTSVRPMLLKQMHNRIAFAKSWGDEIGAPVVTTEAWGPWWHMDHRDLDWGWLRDWCEECMGLAGQYGLWGATPWNYAHPYWKNWSEVDWYRRINTKFLKS